MKDKIIVIAKVIIQFLICIALSFIVTIAVEEYIFCKLFIFWYMTANKVTHLRDLSDDYGFGMLGFLGTILVFIIFMPISFLIIWKLVKRLFRKLKIN